MSRDEPSVVARYGEYTIMLGSFNGMFYVYERDVFVGMDDGLDGAVDLIALREGIYFDEDDVEVVG